MRRLRQRPNQVSVLIFLVLGTLLPLVVTSPYWHSLLIVIGLYTMLGVGANMRFLEPERELVTERWYVDAYGYYAWGWFEDQPEGFDNRSFEGVILGISLVK